MGDRCRLCAETIYWNVPEGAAGLAMRCGKNGETLTEDELIWAGAKNGTAHHRDPLPVSLCNETCAFRPCVLEALREAARDWRSVCEVGSMEPLLASLEADLAVGPLLRRSLPSYLAVVEDGRLPRLPRFLINIYLPPARQSGIAVELARHIRQEFLARFRPPNRVSADARGRRRARAPAMVG